MGTETLSYKTIKAASLMKECDEQKSDQRKKGMFFIVLQYLYDEGYFEAAKMLEQETNLNLNKYHVCDNVNLETIILDFEAYYHIKFNRYPKLIKKIESSETSIKQYGKLSASSKRKSANVSLPRLNSTNNNSKPQTTNSENSINHLRSDDGKHKFSKNKDSESNAHPAKDSLEGLAVVNTLNKTPASTTGTPPCVVDYKQMIKDATRMNLEPENAEDRLLKPLGGFMGYSMEWKELAQVISKDIYSQNPNVKWSDIIGLENAKAIVKESVVYPIKFPQLFTGILSPWKGLLLYGPPGTGKTLLAKAIATECQTTFFNISASTIVSKWRGDSEKLVRVLFELARFHAPSTIFLDEIDSLMGQRGGPNSEHEGSRRMKTELLVQMDGLAKSNDLVFLLAASNLPWELDHALLRRLEKRILVGLPTKEARKAMFEHHLPPTVCPTGSSGGVELLAEIDAEDLALSTEGYSGSDIYLVCKEAAMRPLRKVFSVLEGHAESDDISIKLDVIKTADVKWAISKIKPSARTLENKYLKWQKDFESS